jgi:hypothetical protein
MSNYDASRNDERYRFTDTSKREQSEALRLEIEQHVKAFLKKGGKIQVIPIGPREDKNTPFKIKPEQEKQNWKEGKPRKSHAKN